MKTRNEMKQKFEDDLNKLLNLSFRWSQRNTNNANSVSNNPDINYYDGEISKLFADANAKGLDVSEYEDGEFKMDLKSKALAMFKK